MLEMGFLEVRTFSCGPYACIFFLACECGAGEFILFLFVPGADIHNTHAHMHTITRCVHTGA